MLNRPSFDELLTFYIDNLKNDIMPFWIKHCIDRDAGGINNIVTDDGTVLSHDKYMWSQGRALWTFSALYRLFDKDPKWLEIAENIAGFIKEHGRDDAGRWAFKLHRDGTVAEPPKSIYVDAFIMIGLTEYYAVTNDPFFGQMAKEIFCRTSPLLDDHTVLPTEPHVIPKGFQSHGPYMIFALAYHELGRILNDRMMLDRALELAEIIMTQHLDQNTLDFREFVMPGGGFVDTDAGKTYLPGHIIESMWFMERIYRYHGNYERISLAMRVIHEYINKGWDEEFGGIYLACHTEGGKPVWHRPDSKVWWPITETLYALLRAYEITRQEWCMQWYWRVHDYAFRMYPDKEHGEWHQNLDREGRIIPVVVKNLQVKDPFHLPRALIYSIQVLKRLA